MKMQCKDVPEKPILELLWDINNQDRWGNNCFEDCGDVRHAFPLGFETPHKLVLAKMASLIKRKLVDGCSCGCRGDYVLTDKGCEFIERPRHKRFVGDTPV